MTVIQLDLFSGMGAQAPITSAAAVDITFNPNEGIRDANTINQAVTENPSNEDLTDWLSWCPRWVDGTHYESDPCKACPLRELCSSDDCGFKLYNIDQDEPPYGRYEDWRDGVYD